MPKYLKILFEILPLLAFFITFKFCGMIDATVVLVVLTLISASLLYLYEKKIDKVNVAAAIVLAIFGSLTIFTGNDSFIKMKPTILFLCFAGFLIYGLFKNKLFLKTVFEGKLELSSETWIKLTRRFALFFVFLSILNELVWRNFSDYAWIKFKVFGVLPITLVFFGINLYYAQKTNQDNQK